jgi:putative ABC transport system permease protein
MLADRTTDNGKLLGQNATNNWYLHRPNSDDSTDSVAKLEEALNSALTSMSTVSTDATAGMTTNDIYAISQAVYYENGYAYDNAKYGTNGVGYSGFLANCQSLGASFNQAGVQPFFDDVFAISTDKTMSDSDKASKLANIVLDVFDDPGFYSSDVKIQNSYGIRLIDLIAYSNRYSLISSINITPSNLAAKNTIRSRLDEYNSSNPNTEVIYSDYMSMFTSTLATFIRIISIVLIVFASISLVVSSVMTGIITYTSVVERIKEIGILRACGARKKDVGRLFEAECFVIGFIAGLIGIAFTYLACIPIDQVIYAKYKITNIALLNPWHGAVLLALSVLLAFLSGLIPARLAAKKDPVTALRTE